MREFGYDKTILVFLWYLKSNKNTLFFLIVIQVIFLNNFSYCIIYDSSLIIMNKKL